MLGTIERLRDYSPYLPFLYKTGCEVTDIQSAASQPVRIRYIIC